MAHFAQLNPDNIVTYVARVSNDLIAIEDGEDEAKGSRYLSRLFGGAVWVQTSYNNNFRNRFAGIGMTYDTDLDAFILPQPYPSWTLDFTNDADWVPPVPMPVRDGYWYEWDEGEQQWIEHQIEGLPPEEPAQP